jgi:hypothetical protein
MAESLRNPESKFYYDYREAWSFADMDELRLHCETGGTVEGAATLLSRTFEEVRHKAIELRLIK